MIIRLPTAARPLQVGVTGRRPAASPAHDAGLTGFAAEGAQSTKVAQGHDDCSDDGRKGDYSKHAGKVDCLKDGKGEYSKHDGGSKDATNEDCQPHKDDSQPQKHYCDPKPSDDGSKGDTYRNPGEALAKFDFSHGDFSHGDFGSHGSDHSGDIQGALASMSSDDALEYAISQMGPADHSDVGHFDVAADASHDTDA